MRTTPGGRGTPTALLGLGGVAAVGAGIWLASLAAVSAPEVLAAAIAGLVAAGGAALARRALAEPRPVADGPLDGAGSPPAGTGGSRPRPGWRPLVDVLVRLPGTVLLDTARVIRRAAGRHPDGGFRTVELGPAPRPAGGGDARRGDAGYGSRRRAGATMLLGVTPGTYVTEIDRTTGRAVVHALVPRSAAERALTRAPGASGPGDSPRERPGERPGGTAPARRRLR